MKRTASKGFFALITIGGTFGASYYYLGLLATVVIFDSILHVVLFIAAWVLSSRYSMTMLKEGAKVASDAHDRENKANLEDAKERTQMLRAMFKMGFSGGQQFAPGQAVEVQRHGGQPMLTSGQPFEGLPNLIDDSGQVIELSPADFGVSPE